MTDRGAGSKTFGAETGRGPCAATNVGTPSTEMIRLRIPKLVFQAEIAEDGTHFVGLRAARDFFQAR